MYDDRFSGFHILLTYVLAEITKYEEILEQETGFSSHYIGTLKDFLLETYAVRSCYFLPN